MGIVKKLVDMMDETIEVYSKLGEGSKFVVRFPCRIATEDDLKPKDVERKVESSKLENKKILLAEDKQKALEVGMNGHVAKPIDMSKLIQLLEKFL